MTEILDTHVHFWDHGTPGLTWPWLERGFRSDRHRWTETPTRRRTLDSPRYAVGEFRGETSGSGVAGVVHAHCAVSDDDALETEWLDRMAEADGWPLAIIGRGDLSAPDGAERLRRHRSASERCRSVRDMKARDGIDFDACAPALEEAATLGFAIELRTDPSGFAGFAELAGRWPDVTFVLSHAGLPLDRTPRTLREWVDSARALAERPNWVCKISALCGGSDPDWTVESIRPWAEACVDVFGVERCMLGTNWPVDSLFGSYEQVVAAMREIFDGLSEADRVRLFRGTAVEVYGLADVT